jgi:hypothetical protein
MSYDLYLKDPVTRKTIEFSEPHHMRGGTYSVGGTTEARLNITYNYFPQFARAFPDLAKPRKLAPAWMCDDFVGRPIRGIRTIYGLTGAESMPLLAAAIAALGDDVDPDYWKPTDGNAKRALVQLRALAMMRPDGIWDGD